MKPSEDVLVDTSSNLLFFRGKQYRCAIGKNGATKNKKEGDGCTPIGCFLLRGVFYRADRVKTLETKLPARILSPNDGWCDDVSKQEYNQLIKLPFDGNYELLWRGDGVYDMIAVIGYNDQPIMRGMGSAIFLHIARNGYAPTNGCVAVAQEDLLEILRTIEPTTKICIRENH